MTWLTVIWGVVVWAGLAIHSYVIGSLDEPSWSVKMRSVAIIVAFAAAGINVANKPRSLRAAVTLLGGRLLFSLGERDTRKSAPRVRARDLPGLPSGMRSGRRSARDHRWQPRTARADSGLILGSALAPRCTGPEEEEGHAQHRTDGTASSARCSDRGDSTCRVLGQDAWPARSLTANKPRS